MPSRYDYEPDDKLHTRFSELRNCTIKGVTKVVFQRLYGVSESSPYMEFGTTRHEVFSNFLLTHRKLPKQIPLDLEINEDMVERSYAIEVWKNVVIHLTPDIHNTTWVADFKTTTRGAINYKTDKQVVFYAWLLNKLGHKITKGYYICELWDRDRTKIQGYEFLERDITQEDIDGIEDWAKKRVQLLYMELTKDRELGEVSNCCSAKVINEICQDCLEPCGKVTCE